MAQGTQWGRVTGPSIAPHCCFANHRKLRRALPAAQRSQADRTRHRCRADPSRDNTRQRTEDAQLQERLQTAEREAAELRQQLDAARQAKGESSESGQTERQAPAKTRSRIDGGNLKREGLFSAKTPDWLDESGISASFRAKGPVERVAEVTSTESETVKRRLIIGSAITAVALALALIPSDAFRLLKPSKPIFLYLLPLLRAQELLPDLEDIVANGRWDELPPAMDRVQGSPTNLIQNMQDAAASVPDRRKGEQAAIIVRGIRDDLEAVDYTKYYSSVKKKGANTGTEQKQYSEFSSRAVKAVQSKLKQFLALMPPDDIRQATALANSGE